MKIIKPGKIPNAETIKEFWEDERYSCPNCNTVIELSITDASNISYTTSSRGLKTEEGWIKCPTPDCGETIRLLPLR
jgi:hypothetical protein